MRQSNKNRIRNLVITEKATKICGESISYDHNQRFQERRYSLL